VTKTLLSSTEVARRLGVSIKTVHRLARAGQIPGAQKLPGRTGAFIFDPDMLDAWLTGRKAKAS